MLLQLLAGSSFVYAGRSAGEVASLLTPYWLFSGCVVVEERVGVLVTGNMRDRTSASRLGMEFRVRYR